MATIKTDIRFYQPNDPYYWEVDNLPLSDLLANDIVLENRLSTLEDDLGSFGDSVSGSFSTGAISDLKGYSEALSGSSSNFGKVFVRSGKFLARVQMPATRESGWRMMRDQNDYFNNDKFSSPGTGMLDANVLTPFVRDTRGLARTAMVEFYANPDGTSKFIPVESFDAEDFNAADAPTERLDLVYIKGSTALDTDGDATTTPSAYSQTSIPTASIGIIKGAYFRSDSAAGLHSNGARFTDANDRLYGRTTGMSNAELPVATYLDGFGTVPMPEDLVNFAWHKCYSDSTQNASNETLATKQIETEAAFCMPVAYVRVPRNYVAGDPILQENVIDIRPFLRSAELTYSERAAVAASVDPNGANPFITQDHLLTEWVTPLQTDVATNAANIASVTAHNSVQDSQIKQLQYDVSGPAALGLDHEGRIVALENSGIGQATHVELHKFLNEEFAVYTQQRVPALGTAGAPVEWDITEGIPADHRLTLVAVQFRVMADGLGNDTDSVNRVYMQGGTSTFRIVSRWGVAQSSGDLRRNDGQVNTFYYPVKAINSGSLGAGFVPKVYVYTYATGSNDVDHYLYIDGYIHSVSL